mgnify:CR=1 FL=1
MPSPPADWSGATLVLAEIWATGSTTAAATYEVLEREPIRTTYKGYELVTASPPSSGSDTVTPRS